MKRITLLLTAAILLFSQQSLAGDLEKYMKDMEAQFKIIALGARAGSFGQKELDATELMQMASAEASMIYPETANTDALKAKYSILMADLTRHSLVLESQIEEFMDKGNDAQLLPGINATIQTIAAIRREGHELFKPAE